MYNYSSDEEQVELLNKIPVFDPLFDAGGSDGGGGSALCAQFSWGDGACMCKIDLIMMIIMHGCSLFDLYATILVIACCCRLAA